MKKYYKYILFITNIILITFLCNYFSSAQTIQEQLKIIDKQDFYFLEGRYSLSYSTLHYFDNSLFFIPTDQDIIANDTSLYIFHYTIQNKNWIYDESCGFVKNNTHIKD